MRKVLLMMGIMLFLPGCNNANEENMGKVGLSLIDLMGLDFSVAKAALQDDGWIVEDPLCSDKKLCFDDGALSTDIVSSLTCAKFSNKNFVLEVCVELLNDGGRVNRLLLQPKFELPINENSD